MLFAIDQRVFGIRKISFISIMPCIFGLLILKMSIDISESIQGTMIEKITNFEKFVYRKRPKRLKF